MWIDMIDPEQGVEIPQYNIKELPPAKVELRIIIWGCRSLPLLDLDSLNVMVSVNIDCDAYTGPHPITQDTDVHYGSKNGNAIFNYR